MGKHSHKNPHLEGRRDQPAGKHTGDHTGFRVGNQDPSKRGLGNAQGNKDNR